MRTLFAVAAVLLAAASTAAIAAPANGTIELAREATDGARRQSELQAPATEAGAVLVREGASGGGRQRQNHGVRGI